MRAPRPPLFHVGMGFQSGIRFQVTTFSSIGANTPPPHPTLPPPPPHLGSGAWLWSSPEAASRPRRSRRCHPSHRSYSLLFAAANDGNGGVDAPPPGDTSAGANAPEGDFVPSLSDGDGASVSGADDGGAVKPEPREDEQVTGNLANEDVTGGWSSKQQSAAYATAAGESGDEEQVDWDKAWASTRQRMEQEKEAAPAFSKRKQVVATKNTEGGYDFEEISADGSRRMRGDEGSGGFGFADSGQVEGDGPGRVRRQEQEAVNLATTNKAFAGLFALLLASLIFEVYVYMSGGITNGSTRFLDIGQPTTYDQLPLPPTPPPDDLTV